MTLSVRWGIGDMMYEWPRWMYCFTQKGTSCSQSCGVESGNLTSWFRSDKNISLVTFPLHYLPWYLINWGEYSAGVMSQSYDRTAAFCWFFNGWKVAQFLAESMFSFSILRFYESTQDVSYNVGKWLTSCFNGKTNQEVTKYQPANYAILWFHQQLN